MHLTDFFKQKVHIHPHAIVNKEHQFQQGLQKSELKRKKELIKTNAK